MSNARDSILARLQQRQYANGDAPAKYLPQHGWSKEEKIKRLSERMSAVRGEVINLTGSSWVDWVNQQLPQRALTRILIGDTAQTRQLQSGNDQSLHIKIYDQAIDSWKSELFNQIDVGITTTKGAIAETGSLILWPDSAEPRLMSLVPPVHIALLHADQIYETFAQVVSQQNWADNMPTNALLISGPSKTADIEQTLAYGIHGPQQLIVLIID